MYRFWVFIHILGVAGFLMTHGVALYAMFAVRSVDGDRGRILTLCELSKRTTAPMYVSLLLLLLGGIGAGIDAHLFAQTWLWGSLVVLVLLMAAMSMTAAPYMTRLREGCTRWHDDTYPMSDEELQAQLAGPMTVIVAAYGGLGLLLILYLMVYKPGA